VIPLEIESPRVGFWTRKRKLAATTVALLLVVGVAVAALLLRAPLTGGGTIVAATEFTAATVQSTTGVGACTASVQGGGTSVALDLNNVQPGFRCEVRFGLRLIGSPAPEMMVVQRVRYATVIREELLGLGCGAEVSAAGQNLDVAFVVPDTPTLGGFTAQPDAGIELVQASLHVPADCSEV
jgi:hypothetical protein